MNGEPAEGALRSAWRARLRPPRLVGHAREVALLVLAAVVGVSLLVLLAYFAQQAATLEPAAPTLRADRKLADPGDFLTDTDVDGLPDILEDFVYGTDPTRLSTSGAGIPDGWLVDHGLDPLDPDAGETSAAFPKGSDVPPAYEAPELPPRFRLTVRQAYDHGRPAGWSEATDGVWKGGLDPRTYNNSGSGIPDGWLAFYGLALDDPAVGAGRTAGEAFTVYENFLHHADPRKVDSDDDGLTDVEEVTRHGTHPSKFSTSGAGVPDGWLVRYGLDPHDPNVGRADTDRDGLTNLEEFSESRRLVGEASARAGGGLDPLKVSTLDNGIPDGWLTGYGLSPLEPGIAQRVTERATDTPTLVRDLPAGTPEELAIPDLALTILDEYRYQRPASWREAVDGVWTGGTDPTRSDTDADGLPDVIEIRGWLVNVSLRTGPDAGREPLVVFGDATRADSDADGLTDIEEYGGRATRPTGTRTFPLTNPLASDSDFDGLPDPDEVFGGTVGGRAYDFGTGAFALSPARADSDDDFLGDGAELTYWDGRERGVAASTAYTFAADHTYTSVLEWLRKSGVATAAAKRNAPLADAALIALLGPGGDVDGDGVPNLMDRDADGDGLLDGWEFEPDTYARVDPGLFTLGATLRDSAHPRSASDPANTDTDGDRLPDGWEVGHGQFDFTRKAFDLDPSRKSTFGETRADGAILLDGERDLDADGVTWVAIRRGTRDDATAEEATYVHTNLREFDAGTDPHAADTSGDGIPDGFGHFWACVYPDLPDHEKGEVRPRTLSVVCGGALLDPLQDVADTAMQLVQVVRFTKDVSDPVLRADLDEEIDREFQQERIKRVLGRVTYTLASVSANRTNPFLLDTDGDGMADAWEAFYGLDPANPADRRGDGDRDRLANVDEFLVSKGAGFVANDVTREALEDAGPGSDPTKPDTDLGGAADGNEEALVGPFGDFRVDPTHGDDLRDLDFDALRGPEDPSPLDPDLDHDGLLDGETLDPVAPGSATAAALLPRGVFYTNLTDGRLVFLGERDFRSGSDPTRWDSVLAGIPDGWLARQQCITPLNQEAAELAFLYGWGRPAWWSEPEHGPWKWGHAACPEAGGAVDVDADGTADWVRDASGRLHLRDADLDNDGLNDDPDVGEDPLPAASHSNVASTDPRAAGLDADARLLAGQAYGPDPAVRRATATLNHDGADEGSLPRRVPDREDRVPVEIQVTSIGGVAPSATGPRIVKGENVTVLGRAVVHDLSANGTPLATVTPVPNAVVVIGLNGKGRGSAIGAGVTRPDGTFEVTGRVAAERDATVAPAGVTLFGVSSGPVAWAPGRAAATRLGAPPLTVQSQILVWTTNTSATLDAPHPQLYDFAGAFRDAAGNLFVKRVHATAANVSVPVNVTVASPPFYEIAPSKTEASRLDTLRVELVVVDGAGAPIPDRTVAVSFAGGSIKTPLPKDARGRSILAVDAEGRASFDVSVTAGSPGAHAIVANLTRKGDAIEAYLLDGAEGRASIRVRFPVDLTFGLGQGVVRVGDFLSASGSVRDNLTGLAAPGNVTIAVGGGETRIPVRSDGSFAGAVAVPGSTPPGLRTVSVRFLATDLHAETSLESQVTVKGIARILGLGPAEVQRGQDVIVAGRLVGHLNQSIPGPVTAVLGGRQLGSNATEPDGSFRIPGRIPNVNLGKVDLLVRYPGSTTIEPAEARVTYTLVSRVTFELDAVPKEAVRGRVVELAGALVDDVGDPAAHQGVHALYGGNETSVDVTGVDGRFRLPVPVPADAPLAAVEIRLDYPAVAEGLLKPHARSLFVPVKAGVTLALADVRTDRGPARLAGSLVDDHGAAIPGAGIDLTLDDIFVGRTASGSSGAFSLPIIIATETPVGMHAAVASFAGTATHVAARTVAPVDVKSATVLTVAVPVEVVRGTVFEVTGNLFETGGFPVDGPRVNVLLDGVDIGTGLARAGVFRVTVSVPAGAGLGAGRLTTEFLGTTHLDAVEVVRDVQVKAQANAIIDLPRELTAGEEFRATVTLTDDVGAPVGSARAVAESPVYPFPVLVETDEEGRATFFGVAPREGAIALTVRFAGTDRLAATTFTSESVRVEQPPTPAERAATVLAILLIVLLAALGVAYVVLRRRLLGEVERLLREAREELIAGNEYVAVIYMAYKRLVGRLAAYGFLKRESATAREFADAVQRAVPVDRAALGDFVGIFEEAIYSAHEVGARERDRAIDAFYRIETDLRKYQKRTTHTGG